MNKKQPLALRALFRTILCFAIFHLAYLAIMAVAQGEWSLVSLFSILDFGMIAPGLESSIPAFFGGVAVIGIVYAVCFFTVKRDSSY
jgi:hypothetical protein